MPRTPRRWRRTQPKPASSTFPPMLLVRTCERRGSHVRIVQCSLQNSPKGEPPSSLRKSEREMNTRPGEAYSTALPRGVNSKSGRAARSAVALFFVFFLVPRGGCPQVDVALALSLPRKQAICGQLLEDPA